MTDNDDPAQATRVVEAAEYYDQYPDYTSTSAASPALMLDFFSRLRPVPDRQPLPRTEQDEQRERDTTRAKATSGARLLDVGCGYGDDAAVAELFGHEVVGVDPSPEALTIFRKGKVRRGHNFGLFDLKDHEGEIGQASFDAVLCGFVLIHIPAADAAAAFENLAAMLPGGGRILVATSVVNEQTERSYPHAHFGAKLAKTTFRWWPESVLNQEFMRSFDLERAYRASNRGAVNLYLEGTKKM